MKVKVTEYNGALTVSVFGLEMGQELVISSEMGGFAFELRDKVEGSPAVELETLPEENIPVEHENEMFSKLSGLRREMAAADGVPPYMVFHDKTLREMVEKRPADMKSLADVSGVGQAKLEKYGERFLAVINGAAA